ncbi:Crp/Fnr family transcriptional regulator [soil metagenome]
MNRNFAGALIQTGNRLLASLPSDEYRRLASKLEEVDIKHGTYLFKTGDEILDVYFPNSGFISLLAGSEKDGAVGTAIIGTEGMLGLSLVLGAKTSVGWAIVEGSGTAMRMSADDFASENVPGGVLVDPLLRYARLRNIQMHRSIWCNRFHNTQERLARRIITMSQMMGSDELETRHNLLAKAIGTRRETVTNTLTIFRKENLIRTGREMITIIDHPGLATASCPCDVMLGAKVSPETLGSDVLSVGTIS